MSAPPPRPAPLPVHVLGGYLGAGKTTLVNSLLRSAAGRRLAVLVNDFGELAIDAELIDGAGAGASESMTGAVLSLTGGCVCCAFGDDLPGALRSLRERRPPPDAVLLECSGVGLPGAVARAVAVLPGVQVQAVWTVVDATRVQALAADAYLADTVQAQWAQADALLLNRMAEVPEAAAPALLQRLRAVAPDAAVHLCDARQAQAEWLLDAPPRDPGATFLRRAQGMPEPPDAARLFRHELLDTREPVDVPALLSDWADAAASGSPVLRAKGWLRDAQGQGWQLQFTGAQTVLERCEAVPAWRLLLIRRVAAARLPAGEGRGFRLPPLEPPGSGPSQPAAAAP